MSADFKKCPNGHYYQGESSCPYCNEKNGTGLHDFYKREPEQSWGISPSPDSKVCPNHHAYTDSNRCPYCGEDKSIGTVDMHTGNGYSIIGRSARQPLKVVVDGKEFSVYNLVVNYWVWHWASRIKSAYVIETGCGDCVGFRYDSVIQIGDTCMTGKEFVKMCDVIIDNQMAWIGM